MTAAMPETTVAERRIALEGTLAELRRGRGAAVADGAAGMVDKISRKIVDCETEIDALADADHEARRREAEAVAAADADRRAALEREVAAHMAERAAAIKRAEASCRALVLALGEALVAGNRAAAASAVLGRRLPFAVAGPGGERALSENISAVFKPLSAGRRFGGVGGILFSTTWKRPSEPWT